MTTQAGVYFLDILTVMVPLLVAGLAGRWMIRAFRGVMR